MAKTGSVAARGNAFKLFHSVVVLGAALGTGCGQTSGSESDAGGQSSSTGGAGGQAGSTGGLSIGGIIDVTTPSPRSCDYVGGQRGTADAPLGPADCAAPEQLNCRFGASSVECSCDPSAPMVPTDCATTTQFNCVVFEATLRACCSCDLGAPADSSECSHGWQCQSYDPPSGCRCNVVIL